MSDSVAVPTKPFRVLTQDGRNLIMDAIDSVSLLREIGNKYGTVHIAPISYPLEPELDGFEQLELNSEIEGANTAA